MNALDQLKRWFDSLPRDQQEEVVRFLYGGKVLLQEGRYCGPHPELVVKGLHCGPAPQRSVSLSVSRVCPTCGRPL
jgi:hypothetical protein